MELRKKSLIRFTTEDATENICRSIDKLTDMLSWMPIIETNQNIAWVSSSIQEVSTACQNILEQMQENQEVFKRIADALEKLVEK